ncbi:hypothetical protein WMY93_002311 [Mugilogobius chulae]|uniref:Uncharacterized protein n=1 Tax=Mugilogobius chulae TaxID=88201 RepID=A0AAW0PVC2_9GOBI
MDGLDSSVRSVLEAAGIDDEVLATINREDLKDLFPGAENFFQRKKIWDAINQKCKNTTDQISGSANTGENAIMSASALSPDQTQSFSPETSGEKTMKMPETPEYVVYTDSELDMVRNEYFLLLRNGKAKDFNMSKELNCRLVRNTVTSMVAILRASALGKEVNYPSKLEIKAMSKKVVDYYPMLRDADPHMPYVTVYTKMFKRLQNMRSPRKRQGPMPQRGKAKKTLFNSNNSDNGTEGDVSGYTSGEMSATPSDFGSGSRGSTIPVDSDDLSESSQNAVPPLMRSPSLVPPATSPSGSSTRPVTSPATPPVPPLMRPPSLVSPSTSTSGSSARPVTSPATPPDEDSLKMQARHYRTLRNMYKKPNAKPNPDDVVQLLNLEFKARRAFIDADVTREEERPSRIFEAYPCFKEIRHAMDELGRIVDANDNKFVEGMKARWSTFCSKAQFFGIWKKALKPPLPLDWILQSFS